ncbi:hypothetical protein PI125_g4186 [Phytophthora idaei]|nr:hypothetical protein PI125_g4186 [Phytophthora idaei]KAG3166760.1 hypothetical protein PI126_g4077 [Phytophthora idaei]
MVTHLQQDWINALYRRNDTTFLNRPAATTKLIAARIATIVDFLHFGLAVVSDAEAKHAPSGFLCSTSRACWSAPADAPSPSWQSRQRASPKQTDVGSSDAILDMLAFRPPQRPRRASRLATLSSWVIFRSPMMSPTSETRFPPCTDSVPQRR